MLSHPFRPLLIITTPLESHSLFFLYYTIPTPLLRSYLVITSSKKSSFFPQSEPSILLDTSTSFGFCTVLQWDVSVLSFLLDGRKQSYLLLYPVCLSNSMLFNGNVIQAMYVILNFLVAILKVKKRQTKFIIIMYFT